MPLVTDEYCRSQGMFMCSDSNSKCQDVTLLCERYAGCNIDIDKLLIICSEY